MQPSVEKSNAQSSEAPYDAPANEAVVMVPGPINAAEMTDQKRILRNFFFKERNQKDESQYTAFSDMDEELIVRANKPAFSLFTKRAQLHVAAKLSFVVVRLAFYHAYTFAQVVHA